MEKYESVLKFKNYIVNEVIFKTNQQYVKNSDEGINIDISIIPEIKINNDFMQILLRTNIFDNAIEKNYPFQMQISITGEFIVEGDSPEKFIKNAIAIMYPYIRAIVSTYTASSNISPVILPAINVNKLIESQEEE